MYLAVRDYRKIGLSLFRTEGRDVNDWLKDHFVPSGSISSSFHLISGGIYAILEFTDESDLVMSTLILPDAAPVTKTGEKFQFTHDTI